MYINDQGGIVLEQCLWPGNIGDQMADTCRLIKVCEGILAKDPLNQFAKYIRSKLDHKQFISPYGYLRSPKAPYKGELDMDGNPIKDSWREDDTSGDQYQAGLLVFDPNERKEMRCRIVRNYCRYGNNQFIHPGFGMQLANWKWGTTQTLNSQVDLFQFKWRWSDEHNAFREMENSSADYLNYSLVASDQPKWLRERTPASLLKEKWAHYWRNEPNKEFMLELVNLFLDMHYT